MTNHKTLIILGAGGHGKVVVDAALKMNTWKKIFFLDDNLVDETILGIEVIAPIKDFYKFNQANNEFVVAVGNNDKRELIQNRLIEEGCEIATIVHPFTSIGLEVTIGRGTVILAGTIINSSSKIGNGCILNTSCTVDHDNIIEDFVHISPGANLAGNVTVGQKTWIGTNATIKNNINIMEETTIGANSFINKDIERRGTYIGTPFKKL